MTNQILKETITEYGFEETLAAMIELTKEGYILEFYSIHDSNLLRFQLDAILTGWINYHSDNVIADFDYKDAQINEDLCPNFLK
jgi:hypothetical protein